MLLAVQGWARLKAILQKGVSVEPLSRRLVFAKHHTSASRLLGSFGVQPALQDINNPDLNITSACIILVLSKLWKCDVVVPLLKERVFFFYIAQF